ncbi:pilin [Patescibacteria group bacterium]|nr:pilin [Patescibacteria group bacterium]
MKEDLSQGCIFTGQSVGSNDIPSLGCLAQVIVSVINWAFVFLGAVTLLMLLWGAIRFVTSGGDPKAVQGAQKTITYAIVGIIVVLGAYVIVSVITTALGLPNPLQNFRLYQP